MGAIKGGGVAAIVGAVMAIVGNAVVLGADHAVADDRVSYPLSTHAFQYGQVYFALTQALMAWGIIALVRLDVAQSGKAQRVWGWLAAIGMALTVPGELALVLVASESVDSGAAAAATTVFGVGALLADIGLIGFGAIALRQRRKPTSLAALPLILGLFQLLVVTPISFALGFASTGSFIAIAIAGLLTAAIGVGLIKTVDNSKSTRRRTTHE